ncbi:trypsin-like serine peptidase [Pseudonocardia sediminis]|uniref:trypsin-like serine peptidase n=1 Tax=Pseudonocardia sediminis TaxID=1397368 RepID=UPI001028AFBA|nr:trypsin-like serine protease [Pseudonocardia sediminis]
MSPAARAAQPLVGGLAASTVGVLVVDGGRHQCSASVVASRSRRLLATAAHCVWLDDAWQVDGAVFIPGYASGEEPFGRWPVQTAWVPKAWQAARSPIDDVAAETDVAFVSLAPVDGRLAEEVLGAQGIRFFTPDRLTVAALGYPAIGAYDGQSLQACTGAARTEDFVGGSSTQVAGQVLVMTCDMTEGASGGPWLTGPDPASGRGQVIGVVSGGNDTDLLSPKFGAAAEDLYNTADTAASQSQNTAPDQSQTPLASSR